MNREPCVGTKIKNNNIKEKGYELLQNWVQNIECLKQSEQRKKIKNENYKHQRNEKPKMSWNFQKKRNKAVHKVAAIKQKENINKKKGNQRTKFATKERKAILNNFGEMSRNKTFQEVENGNGKYKKENQKVTEQFSYYRRTMKLRHQIIKIPMLKKWK